MSQLQPVFTGGPEPIYPRIRPLTEEEEANPSFQPVPPEEDEDWCELVQCGGAGDNAETKEQQEKRYETKNEDSPEVFPMLAKNVFRTPDLIITCSMDYTIRTWDCHEFKQVQLFEGHFNFVNAVVPYRGKMFVSCSDDCTVRLWKCGTAKEEYGELLTTYFIVEYPIKSVAVVPGERFVCGGLDQNVRVVSFVTGQILMKLDDHAKYGPENNFFQKEGCGSVSTCLHIRQNLVATGSDDGTCRFWDIDKGKCIHCEKGHKGYGRDIGDCGIGYKLAEQYAGVWKVCNLGDDGRHVCSCSYDRTLSIWDVADPNGIKVVRNWRVGDNGVIGVAPVGPKQVASCCGDKDMRIWNWETTELLLTVRSKNGMPQMVCYLGDHKLAMAGGDSTIRILDWSDGVKDLVGKKDHGFYAHDFTISDCVGLVFSDDDEANFTEPIMYCQTPKEEGIKDAEDCVRSHRKVLSEALLYVQPGFME